MGGFNSDLLLVVGLFDCVNRRFDQILKRKSHSFDR